MANNGFKFNGQDLDTVLVPRSFFNQSVLWGWGSNYYGQLGTGTIGDTYYSPVQTSSGGINWKQSSAGFEFSGSVKDDGTLWMWGRNNYGQLGASSGTNQSSPIQTSSGGTNWKSVSCSTGNGLATDKFTTAIKSDGTLWCWGRNTQGQLGDNSVTQRANPTQTISGGPSWFNVSAGGLHTLATKTDGTLWVWGGNNYGQLGTNSTIKVSSPNQVIGGGTNWNQIAAGAFTSAAIKTDGTLWVWGRNSSGDLGNNTTINQSSPVQTIASGTNWSSISNGNSFMLSIKTDGTLWGWGRNDNGQLGDNTTINSSSPVQTVSGGTGWRQASAGYNFTGAIKTDGTLWMWGTGGSGELGNNSNISRSSPVQTIASGTNWSSIAAGTNFAIGMIYVYAPF